MIYTHLAAALIAASAAAFGTWQIQEWRYGAKESERLEEVARDRMRAEKNIDTAAVGHEKDKRQIETEYLVITERITNVVKEPYYAGPDAPSCLDESGMRVLTDAIRGTDASGKPAGAVPRPVAADRR